MNTDNNAINCFKCKHFSISWDPQHPRQCKLYGFKTASMPSLSVYKTSGEKCLGFEPKVIKR